MNQTYLIATSILIGFALVAGALYMSNTPILATVLHQRVVSDGINPQRADESQRYIYGNPKAQTTIVEFSDFQCPYCAQLHPTLQQIVDASDGTINWEYRHLPLSIHAHAQQAAVVGECVGMLGGNDAFWKYGDTLFNNQDKLSDTYITQTAIQAGVEKEALQKCVSGTQAKARVAKDASVAQSLGGNGTPFNVIIYPDGRTKTVSGALPLSYWNSILGS